MSPLPCIVELRTASLRLALRPDLGGAVAGFWHQDVPVLCSVEPRHLAASRPSACFPLVPYSNRLGHRHFMWEDEAYSTAANMPGSAHSVHGTGWCEPWMLVHASATQALIVLDHEADAHWPFAFRATQSYVLNEGPTGAWLAMSLRITNTDARNQPVGLGWHPYFPRRAQSHVRLDCQGLWRTDPQTQLPTERVPYAGLNAAVAGLALDHVLTEWPGQAEIHDELLRVALSASTPYVIVFTPADRPLFCVEPVSHVSNAIQMESPCAHGLVNLAPGASSEIWMRLAVAAS